MLERADSADSGTHNSIASETSTSPPPSRSVSESDGYASAGSTEEPEGQPDRIGETSSPPNSVPVDNSVSSNSNPVGPVSNELRPVVPSVSATQDRGSATPSDTVLDILEEMEDEGQDVPGQISVVMPDTRTEDPAHEMSDAIKVNMPESVSGSDSDKKSTEHSDFMDSEGEAVNVTLPIGNLANVVAGSLCPHSPDSEASSPGVAVEEPYNSSTPSGSIDSYAKLTLTMRNESANASMDPYCEGKDITVPEGEPVEVDLDSGSTMLGSSTPSDPMELAEGQADRIGETSSPPISVPVENSANPVNNIACPVSSGLHPGSATQVGGSATSCNTVVNIPEEMEDIPLEEPLDIPLEEPLDSSTPSGSIDSYSKVGQAMSNESANTSVDSYCEGKDITVSEGEPVEVGLDSGNTAVDTSDSVDPYSRIARAAPSESADASEDSYCGGKRLLYQKESPQQ